MKTKIKAFSKAPIFQIFLLLLSVSFFGCTQTFEVQEESSSSLALSDLSSPFVCSKGMESSKMNVRRLTSTEYKNTVARIFNNQITEIKTILESVPQSSVSSNPDQFPHMIDLSQMGTFENMASQIMMTIRTSTTLVDVLKAGCLKVASPTQVCKETVVKNLGLLAFRRPLETQEVAEFVSVLGQGANAAESMGFLVYALLLTPEFNFHLPLGGAANAIVMSSIPLDSYQVASRLSYFLWDAPPDDILFDAASKNELIKIPTLEAQVDRMLLDPRAIAKMNRFFSFWLLTDNFSSSSYSTAFLKGVDSGKLGDEAQTEMNEFVNYVLWMKKGSLKDLFTGRESFAKTATLASVYGHAPMTGTTPAQMEPSRAGVLMRIPVIMSEGNETRPIVRGSKIRQRVLCDTLGAPSGVSLTGSEFFTDPYRMKYSTRYRTDGLTGGGSCISCHQFMNPIGFTFENFDSLGRVRTKERAYAVNGADMNIDHDIDTNVNELMLDSLPRSATNAMGLVQHLATAPKVKACVAKQWYRFYTIQNESPSENCMLNDVFGSLSENNGSTSVRDAFKKLLVSRSFLTRSLAP